jgi:hypothetical protein
MNKDLEINTKVVPTYKDIYDDDPNIFVSSIDAIPIQFVTIICEINALFYKYDDQDAIDHDIVTVLFGKVLSSTSDGKRVRNWMLQHNSNTILNSYTVSQLYITLFSINSFKPDNYSIKDEDFLVLLKLVLVSNQKRMYPEDRLSFIKENINREDLNADFFQRIAWGHNLAQIDSYVNSNFTFEACRCIIMMQFLLSHDETKPIIDSFLKKRHIDSPLSYGVLFILIIQSIYIKDNEFRFRYIAEPQIEALLTPLCITTRPKELIDIKKHPVFRSGDFFYILNLNYLTSQIFTGTYFSLKEEIKKRKHKDNLKSEIGSIMEAHLLKPTFLNCFGNIASKLKFDCDFSNKGYPDVLIQIGHAIFIIELKDNLLDEKTMESRDFETITNKLEEVFVASSNKNREKSKPKAVIQIINYTEKLLENEYNNNELCFSYEKSNYIYPIIIFTDYRYNSSGIGYYIRSRFCEIIKQKRGNISKCFRKGIIKPVTFIGLDFFFNNIPSFSKDKNLLKKLIDTYQFEIKKEEYINSIAPKPFERDLFPSFERFHSNYNFVIPPVENPIEFFELFGIKFPK